MMNDTIIDVNDALVEKLNRVLTKYLTKPLTTKSEEDIAKGIHELTDNILIRVNNMNVVVEDLDSEFTIVGDVVNVKFTIPKGLVECSDDECRYTIDSSKLPGLDDFTINIAAKLEGKKVQLGLLHSTHTIKDYTNIQFTSLFTINVNARPTLRNFPNCIRYRCKYIFKKLLGKIYK